MSQIQTRVTRSHTKRRDVHPHSQNHHISSSPSMNPDPVPPVRPPLTHVIPAEPVRREAGIILGTSSLLLMIATRNPSGSPLVNCSIATSLSTLYPARKTRFSWSATYWSRSPLVICSFRRSDHVSCSSVELVYADLKSFSKSFQSFSSLLSHPSSLTCILIFFSCIRHQFRIFSPLK